jgi:multiple sugar transport system substrate-binding protein/putative aldouronate transport system substrate-binding protein
MTQTFNDVTEDFQTGAAFFQLFNWLGSSNYNTDEHLAEGKMMYARTADDAKNLSYGLNTNGGDRVWTIGSKTNYPELCMAIINWFSTPDGVMTYNYGPKGVTWDYNADGKAYLTDLGLKTTSDGNTEMPAEYGGTYGDGSFKTNNTTWSADALNPEGNGETFNRIFWESAQGRDVSPIMQDWIDWSGYPNADEYLEGNGNIAIVPGSSYSVSAKSNELQTIWSQVATAVKDGSWKAIYANSDAEYDALVKEMIDSANSYGYAECVEFQKNEAVRRKAAEDESMK